MIEGFWIVQYEGLQGNGGGVVMFIKGRVLGGDNGSTYIGHYNVDGTAIKAEIQIHNYLPGVGSIIGVEGDYNLSVTGVIEGKVIRGSAVAIGKQAAGMALKLTKVAELPA